MPVAGLLGGLPLGFLGCDEVAAGGCAFLFRRTTVCVDVAEPLGDREFLDLRGPLVCGAGLIVAIHFALVCRFVTFARSLGALGGAFDVRRRDDLPRGEFLFPAQQFLGASGRAFTR